MVRELPLLLGAIGTVLGFVTLPWLFFLLALGSASATDYPLGYVTPLSDELFALAWAVSPFLGLVGAFKVKKHGKLGGLLFVAAGTLPWSGISLSGYAIFFWTPLLVLAGILSILNWPGPYLDKEEMDEMTRKNSTS
jgi:hypothetical protein